jgi:hypothetical protein
MRRSVLSVLVSEQPSSFGCRKDKADALAVDSTIWLKQKGWTVPGGGSAPAGEPEFGITSSSNRGQLLLASVVC